MANRIGRGQTFVSAVERGQHRVNVLESLDFAKAIGFDAAAPLRKVASLVSGPPGGFERCNIANAIIKSSDFSSLKIIDCTLGGALLEGTLFVNGSLRGTNLTNASLRMADPSRVDLRGADLSGLDLKSQTLSGMQVRPMAGELQSIRRDFVGSSRRVEYPAVNAPRRGE